MKANKIAAALVVMLLTACGGATNPAPSAAGNTGAAQTTLVAQATTPPQATAASQATTVPETTVVPEATTAPEATAIPEATVLPQATAEPTPSTVVEASQTAVSETPAASGESSSGPKAVLLKALKAAQAAGPYRTKTTVVTPNSTITITGEIIPPDKLHLTSSFGGQSSETTIIGNKLWNKVGGKWTESSDSTQITQMLSQFSKDPESLGVKINNVKYVGPEAVNGTPAALYTYDSTFGEGAQAFTSNAKIWIGEANGLPLKQESVGSPGGVKSTTTQEIEYDPSIVIEPPVK